MYYVGHIMLTNEGSIHLDKDVGQIRDVVCGGSDKAGVLCGSFESLYVLVSDICG